LNAQFDISYQGAFRANAGGESDSNYAVGTLGYNPNQNSLFMAGHGQQTAIAEFKIPNTLSLSSNVQDTEEAEVLQSYVNLLDDHTSDTITGMLAYNDKLLVTSEVWYDASGSNLDNVQALDIGNIASSSKDIKRLAGAARVAGYMSVIPSSIRSILGGDYLVGWASNYSITSRYSQGPSLAVFDPQDAVDNALDVPTVIKQVYPFGTGDLVPGGYEYKMDISPIWGPGAKAKYGFIVPNTSIFMLVGSNFGLHSGVGYKITQDDGRLCGGPCQYEADDKYNYYWLFDVNDIVADPDLSDAQPFSYGKWMMPFTGKIIGAAYDPGTERLYMSLSDAGRTGNYDRPPLIVSYEVKAADRTSFQMVSAQINSQNNTQATVADILEQVAILQEILNSRITDSN